MKYLKILSIMLFIGCSPKISKHFKQNRYVKNFNIHIINDGLQLYFKSPADIVYTTDENVLKKIIHETPINLKGKVLLYGKTNEPPYEYFVSLLPKGAKRKNTEGLVILDTVIHAKTIRFTGRPLAQNARRALRSDLLGSFKSLEVGKGYRKDISSVMEVVQKYRYSNKYLAALHEITAFPAYDRQEVGAKLQMQLTFASFLGDNDRYKRYLEQLESTFSRNDAIAKTIAENVIANAAVIEKITDNAKAHKLVMVNENHYYPNHRILVSELLAPLRKIGYRYLALEALNPGQDSLLSLKNAYPILKTGFYTREQQYANLIRKAKALGYVFVAYENTDRSKNREAAQADNLYKKTFKKDPGARVLVLAGIDHILEQPTQRGKKWMAARFKEQYAIDPLTVSQTHLNAYREQTDADYSLIS